jgi:hypothetical protein
LEPSPNLRVTQLVLFQGLREVHRVVNHNK